MKKYPHFTCFQLLLFIFVASLYGGFQNAIIFEYKFSLEHGALLVSMHERDLRGGKSKVFAIVQLLSLVREFLSYGMTNKRDRKDGDM